MNFKDLPEDEAFRSMVHAKLRAALPQDLRERWRLMTTYTPPAVEQRRWIKILSELGWSVPWWPVEYGGTDWTWRQKFIFEEEIHRLNGPEFLWQGSHLVAPIIYTFGTEEQKARFLPVTRTGELMWCQGFSEPNAGSDLVSMRTTARHEGDHYIVSGQKIWTSGAFESDWGFFLVKTDLSVKPQEGVSFLLIDLTSPGVTVRQIPELDGEAHLCEVFLDNVEVPAENLVGEEGKGWSYAKFLLDHERTTSAFIFRIRRELERTKSIGRTHRREDAPVGTLPQFAARLARLEAEVIALEWSVFRVMGEDKSGFPAHQAASILKIRGAELQQTLVELQVDMIGERAIRYYKAGSKDHEVSAEWPEYVPGRSGVMMITRAATIYGGTNEIQKNILARTAFGL
jgi:alkylation response protein AidB-like acyl-CoA dehydrogenase